MTQEERIARLESQIAELSMQVQSTGGITQEEADARYLKLSGGEVNNGFNVYAYAPDSSYGQVVASASLNNGIAYLSAADEPGSSYVELRLTRNSFSLSIRGQNIISMSAVGGGVKINGLAVPTVDTMPATKKYVDDAIAELSGQTDAITDYATSKYSVEEMDALLDYVASIKPSS